MSVWWDIAWTMRKKVFNKYDAERIDSHDIKVRKQAISYKCQYKFNSAIIGVNDFSLFISLFCESIIMMCDWVCCFLNVDWNM